MQELSASAGRVRARRAGWVRNDSVTACGTILPKWNGQSMSALPGISDVNLLRDRERIIYFDTQIAHGALNLCVPQ